MSSYKITSLQNSILKEAIRLRDNNKRRKSSLFAVEGTREISQALNHDFPLEQVFYCSELFDDDAKAVFESLKNRTGLKLYALNVPCFEKLVVRKNRGGLFFVFREKQTNISEISLKNKSTLCIIDKVEKPGNIGAILRSCDASAVDLVIINDTCVDCFNPNTIRASLGSCFSLPIVFMKNEDIKAFCLANKIKIVSSFISKVSKPYYSLDFVSRVAFVFGSEANGISDFWKENADEYAIIPMQGKIDSLNVSVAAAILLFEANRQRQK